MLSYDGYICPIYVCVFVPRKALRLAFCTLTTGKPEDRVSLFCYMHIMHTCLYVYI